MELVDRIRDTTESHNRCSVVEVMGRDAGYIALYAGIACGATCILLKEIDVDIEKDVIERLRKFRKTDKRHFIIVVSEGVGQSKEIAERIEKGIGMETRATILGHVQRGGSPTARDRVLASEMGYTAVELLAQGIGNRVVVVQNNKIVNVDIYEALQMKKHIDERLYQIAHEISI
jgi:6-phosphofructokinase 1